MTPAAALVAELGVMVSALSSDSRAIGAHTAFVAYPGARDDGRRHIGAAINAGAAGVFWEREDFCWRGCWQKVPNVPVRDLRAQCGHLADVVYGAPSRRLPVVAITGTNGKTTVSHLTAQIVRHAGGRAGVVGTLGAGALDALAPLANTTPAADALHGWLRRFADDGMDAAVIEASSHGLAQGRLNGLRLAAAVFTNAAQDHLDYHADLESYWQAKARLFRMPDVGAAILNADDPFCCRLAEELDGTLLTFGREGAALRLVEARADGGGWALELDGMLGRCALRLPLAGVHNVYNFLAAALAALTLEVPAEGVCAAAATLTLPAGRMQKVSDVPAVFVDYAHTPDALAAALAAARAATADGGRLLAVFGAGGGRDAGKRAAMARAAAAAADVVVVTDDNPRDEDAAAIRAALCEHAAGALNIGDRGEAIGAALARAGGEDTVLILGKGHEQTQEAGGVRTRFSDAAVAREWLRLREGA